MSTVNLKHFVDINIQRSTKSVVSGTRSTVVLFTAEQTDGESHLIESLSDANTIYAGKTNTLAYLQMYFNNGGVAVYVIENKPHNSITEEDIAALQNDKIVIAYAASSSERENAYASLKLLATSRATDVSVYGINEKILLAATAAGPTLDNVKNFAVKYSSVPGAEMTIAAYLSQIDVYGVDTIHDYMYTQENILEEDVSDSTYSSIIAANMNVDIYLANAVRNCGGNCTDGSDLVNNFVRIVLHQTLTDNLLQLLTQKIKSNTGLSKIYTVITNELEKYLTAGYLTTDKIWLNDDLKVKYNGTTYTIVEKGTPLTNGYLVKVLPMSSLTEQNVSNRTAPPVYVIISDQYGIRKITVTGEVI